MSTLQVANLAFESTDNNQITYAANTINIQVGGASNVFFTNGTSTTIKFLGTPANPNNFSVSNNTYTFTSNVVAKTLTTNGQLVFSGNVSPTMLSANVSDWNPGFGNAYFIRVSTNNAVTISGMVEGTNGQIIVLNNVGNNAITLASEDAENENTASRRFLFPRSQILYPYSSLSLIYSGIMQRWIAQNSLGVNFFHKGNLTKGVFAGGITVSPATTATADRTTYSTESTAAVPGANLSQSRSSIAGTGNADKGFFYGSGTPPTTLITDRHTFATCTTVSLGSVALVRIGSSGVGSACVGYFAGTTALSVTSGAINRITYSTEITGVSSAASLTTNRVYSGAVGNACKGFFAGGGVQNPSLPIGGQTTTDRLNYSLETISAVSGAALSQSRYAPGAAGNENKAFVSGGTGVVSTSDRITYATETTAAVPGANLSQARFGLSAAGNACKGFFSGGATPTSVATADRTTYSTETTAAVPGANLSQARHFGASI